MWNCVRFCTVPTLRLNLPQGPPFIPATKSINKRQKLRKRDRAMHYRCQLQAPAALCPRNKQTARSQGNILISCFFKFVPAVVTFRVFQLFASATLLVAPDRFGRSARVTVHLFECRKRAREKRPLLHSNFRSGICKIDGRLIRFWQSGASCCIERTTTGTRHLSAESKEFHREEIPRTFYSLTTVAKTGM